MSRFETYESAMAYLAGHVDLERTRRIPAGLQAFRLDRMRAILERLDGPHEAVPSIHVAGTKGKGSTVAMISAALRGCGLTVGSYTSPHLTDVRERIQINGDKIDRESMRRGLEHVAQAAERAGVENLHYFEILTAVGLLVFALQAVDVAVIEVGLGGRLDATNIINPEVCAMTAVSLDHTSILGTTIARIAREKAGIFKPKVPIVSVGQVEECEKVYREIAEQTPAPIAFLDREIDFSSRFESTPTGPLARVSVLTPRSDFEHVPVPLVGDQQPINCGLSLAVLDRLRARGWRLSDEGIVEGLSQAVLPGRMEVVSDDPRIIIDGAHNCNSVQALVRTLCTTERFDSLVAIFGCAADKDIDGMLSAIAGAADKIIFTRTSDNPRAVDPEVLHERFTRMTGRSAMTEPNISSALDRARSAIGPRDLVVVTGSFYLVGQARKLLLPDDVNPRLVDRGAQSRPGLPMPEVRLRNQLPTDLGRSP